MAETWLYHDLPNGALLSLDEVVRVEIGPQVIELQCSPEHLSVIYTHAVYRVGKRDASGRMIVGDDAQLVAKHPDGVKYGDRMRVVDWDAKFAPRLWKVYRWELLKGARLKWVKVGQFENFDDALSLARQLRKEMTSDAVHH